MGQCDVVLRVHNSLSQVLWCINEVLSLSRECFSHLYVIDDNSDEHTAQCLRKRFQAYSQVSVHRSPRTLGHVASYEAGIRLGSSPYVVLLTSDIMVTRGWLARLVRAAESDPRILAVYPLMNGGQNPSLSLLPGANYHTMDWVISREVSPCYPDAVIELRPCMLLRRALLKQVGSLSALLDLTQEHKPNPALPSMARRYRAVLADNVYVYSTRQGPFEAPCASWKQAPIRSSKAGTSHGGNANDPLSACDLFETPSRWDPLPSMRNTYRRMRQAWWRGQLTEVIREAGQGLIRLPYAVQPVVTVESVARLTRPNRMRVTYVLPSLTLAGGVLSVVQLVNGLISLGVEARIVTLREYPEVYGGWSFLTRPIIFRSAAELVQNFPESDIAVATHWSTAEWVGEVTAAGRAKKAVYFLQDYESWFFSEADKNWRDRVKRTYSLISHKIVKSTWLSDRLAQDGYETTKILLGMDLETFYPRKSRDPFSPTVIAMARPCTPRRGYPYVVATLQSVKRMLPATRIILFGSDRPHRFSGFDYQDEGLVCNQGRLAELYSEADVYLDGSVFQGFGRPALEAMACGTACVLTSVGGVMEYALDGVNCLLVPPKEPEASAKAIIDILQNPGLRSRLVEGGLRTAKRFCQRREARETLAYFESLLEGV